MPQPRPGPAPGLPRWVVLPASAVIAFHLFAVAILVLSAPSGPWPTPFGGPMPAGPPPFAGAVAEATTRYYLMPLKMTHNYHFNGNRPAPTAAYFEVRLQDAEGKPLKTLQFPDEQANPWVRHRQTLLAQELTEDIPVQARPGEAIPAPGQHVPTVTIWDMAPGDEELRLRQVPEHLVPRDRMVARPSEWTMLLAHSYARYVCRTNGAASAEIVRHSREAVMPQLIFMDDPPADAFKKLVSNFGEMSR